jgi:hypothetical protein
MNPDTLRKSEGLPGAEQAALAPVVKIFLQPFSAPWLISKEPFAGEGSKIE